MVPAGRLTQDTVKLIFRREEANERSYLYWLLRTPQYRDYCAGHAMGSAVVALSRRDFLAYPVPPMTESRLQIVSILDALDDKIDLNRRINETLEAMALVLFKSWFVDFDPVRAKVERRDPRLSREIVDLFPGSFEASGLGEIPRGWCATRWGTKVTLEYGRGLTDYTDGAGPYPVYGTNGRIGSHVAPLCQHEGIIIGRKGAYRGIHYSNSPFYVIDTAFYVEPTCPMEMRWGYYELLRTDINNLDSGSAIPSTSREDFYSIQVVWPPIEVQRAFVRQMSPAWERQEVARQESQSLAALRDTLLPKLVSGDLRIRDAAPLVEQVA
jgi:type I restriction enzyme S subunit